MWDLQEKKVLKILKGHTAFGWSACFSPDSLRIASASGDKSVKIWSIESGVCEDTFTGHTDQVVRAVFSPDGLTVASGSYDKSIKIWDLKEKKEKFTLHGHTNCVWNMKFIKQGTHLISVSDDKTIRVWNLEKRAEEFTLLGHTSSVIGLSVSPDERFFATGSGDNLIKIWNIAERREEFSLSGHSQAIWSVCYHPSGDYIASAALDQSIKVWNVKEKREEYTINSHTDMALTVGYSPDGKYLASGAADKLVKLWIVGEGQDYTRKAGVAEIASPQRTSDDSLGINPNFQPLIPFYSVISNLKKKTYDQISANSAGMRVGPLEFTGLHYLAYLGMSKSIEMIYKEKEFIIKADALGHSPIYYSILRQHQKCTDLLLEYLIELGENEEKSMNYMTSFHSIRNDMNIIILNSSKILDRFLSVLIYPRTNTFYSGSPKSPLPLRHYSDTPMPPITDFTRSKSDDQSLSNSPLIIKTCHFPLPTAYGSESSIELLNTILDCTNDEIFRTQFIQHVIRKKWLDLIYWIYFFTLLLWVNLVLLVVMISQDPAWYTIVPVLVVNSFLMIWELVQLESIGLTYFWEIWNWVDIARVVTTFAWAVLDLFTTPPVGLLWVMLVLNILRGLTGFRAFDKTRFYIRLILQSLNDMKFFLIIFMYTTLCFGILNTAASESHNYDILTLWIIPFNLASGDTGNMNTNSNNLQYYTFCFALLVNIVLMFNMIISILGDSFDEFQLKSEIIDYREMAEAVLEIEQIKSLLDPADKYQYLSVCVNPYDDTKGGWGGKMIETNMMIKETQKNLNNRIAKSELAIGENVNSRMQLVEFKVSTVQNDVKTATSDIKIINGYCSSVDKEVKEMKTSMGNMTNGFGQIENKITMVENEMRQVKTSIVELDNKLNSIIQLLTKAE